MKTVVEKERKWLLKRVPQKLWDEYSEKVKSAYIEQFYTEDGWRYRQTNVSDTGKRS
jgi:hypothetical protein